MVDRGSRDDPPRSPGPIAAGAICGALTAVAYLPGLHRPLSYDAAETVGFFVLAPSPVDALKAQRAFNNHPFFSFLEHLVVRAAGHSDEWLLRLLPMTFAALTVAVLVWALGRVLGLLPAVVAGVVLGSNPMFAELGRDVRGYSLMTAVAVVSTVLHLELVRRKSRGLRTGYALVATIGLFTHLLVAPVLLAHGVDVLRRRALDRRWVTTWSAVIGLTLLFYGDRIDDLLSTGESRGRIFRPWFLIDLLQEVLGREWLTVVLLGVVALTGLHRLRRHASAQAAVGVFVMVAVLGWVAAPENLAPRFFVWLVPAAAVLVAHGVARSPRLGAPIALLAAVVSIVGLLPTYTDDNHRYPDMAEIIEREDAEGRRVCVTDLSVAPLTAYTVAFEALVELDEAPACETVVIAHPNLDRDYVEALADDFPHRIELDPGRRSVAIVFSRERMPLPTDARRVEG